MSNKALDWAFALPLRADVAQLDLDAELAAAGCVVVDGIPRAVDRIEPVGGGQYCPSEDGRLAYLIGDIVQGELVDIVALAPRLRPMTRCGWTTMLGSDAIDKARWDDSTPFLIENPIRWLHRPDTTCVIDWRRAAGELRDLHALKCETAELAARARAAFTKPQPIPQLLVPTGR